MKRSLGSATIKQELKHVQKLEYKLFAHDSKETRKDMKWNPESYNWQKLLTQCKL